MNKELLEKLKRITPEEEEILKGKQGVNKELYTDRQEFVVEGEKLLGKGKLIEIRPHTRFVHFPKHRHNYVEMIYVCAGTSVQIINDSNRIELKEGDLLFLNQNVYQEILPASMEDISVNFIIMPEFFDRCIAMMEEESILREFLISTLSERDHGSQYLHFQTKGIVPVQNLMENMIWTIGNQIPNSNTVTQTTMGLLFLNLSLFAETLNKQDPGQYEQRMVFSVLNYIEHNYRRGTLAEICGELNQPTYGISRLLKKYTGCHFKELLQQRKLAQAVYLLTHTALPVEEIISAIGYDNSSYFYRKFRERYGRSPREYREN